MPPKKDSTVEVLISAMNLTDTAIIDKTNIQTNAVLINQCGQNTHETIENKNNNIVFYSTQERGLSKSRNKAIELASGDICLLCDDDEKLNDDYEKLITKAYSDYPDADLITFKFKYPGKKYSSTTKKISWLNASSVSSVEITFKREKITDSRVVFNEYFGAGAKYASGEENLFLFDCLKKKMKIYYVPIEIGSVKQEKSTWFNGFNEKYFFDKGAWLAESFPTLKIILMVYVVYRFRKTSELGKLKTFRTIYKGMVAYRNKLSYADTLLK